jgi:threonine/homoserine/homoserine lactone efflux protein
MISIIRCIIYKNFVKEVEIMNVTSFLIYCIIVTFTPGPTNIVILSTAYNLGTKKALEYCYGATVAFGFLLSISAVLNTTLVAVIPKILVVMQIIGSVYMLYLAYQIYKMEVSEQAMIQTGTFASGILMQFVNPKVVLFTMTVIPSFVIPYYREPMKLALFVSVITLIGFLAFITWVLFGSVFKKFLQKHQKIVNIVMALFLVYSAFMVSGAVELIKR